MRRGPKPAKAKEAKPPVARKSRVRDLEKRLAEALQREAEASKRAAEADSGSMSRLPDLVTFLRDHRFHGP